VGDSTAKRAIELCRAIEDTFDHWRDLGECFDELGRAWIAEHDDEPEEGLRKRMAMHLWALVEHTGINRKAINRSLQLFALEKFAPWVAHFRSESKCRELIPMARWHWSGCKLTPVGKRSLLVIKRALEDIGLEKATRAQIREIVFSARPKSAHRKTSKHQAQNAVKVLWETVDNPREREDLARWLDVLLEASPVAADLLEAAFDRLEQRRTRKAA
jgi:hypothetical protein